MHFEVKGGVLCQGYMYEDLCWFRFPMPFSLLVVYYVHFSYPGDKVCEWSFVEDVIMHVPGKNRICTKVPYDEAGDEPDVIFITEAPEVIPVSMEEIFN